MKKDNRYINAGTNEFYRYGHKAVEKVSKYLEPNENGFYSIPVDGGKYWTIGTSEGKFGEYAKHKNTIFSVNNAGYAWAKAGTGKAVAFVEMINDLINAMNARNAERIEALGVEEDDE